ncbi:RagB/SusD family nutrient uptake outer membrane protein [Prolixibacter sp. SD074]|uniref:RagB/SusD family nutrient uptake outer membrane protein n=1 Tax=Prolixibacter sp. SD074 TaxID=2652391 RepID=UPI00126D9DE2|nr:RagB/SusD family nutrient uptake outer membrane protein [Prolixibacter sp. SD074]GET29871.1 membrane protein [Prolixibacter sp. SD074]
MKLLYMGAAIAAALLTFSGCSGNYLDVPPEGNMTPADYYSDHPTEVVNAVYNKLLDWNESSFSWLGVSSITSDDADKGSDPGDTGTDKNLLDNFTFGADALSFNDVWQGNYEGVARANQALKVLGEVTISDTLRNRLQGETRFLRAYFYWNLVRCFGDVPLIDRVPDPTNAADIAMGNTRVSKDSIYAFIKTDLQYAVANLPLKSEYAAADLGRATKGAAQTFLAKVNLYQKNWSEVLTLTNVVINSGEYSLVSDYSTIWREIGENNSESIFEIQGRGQTPNKGVQGYVDVQSVRGQFGWGFNVPSQDLADTYEAGDLRKDATIIYPGETMWDGVVINSDTPNPMYNQKAYLSRTQETYNGNSWESSKNVRIFRYAEVLLMKAEAANETGDPATALAALNQVRERVGLPDYTDSNQDNLRMKIYHERRVELAFESDRTFDLIREGRAATVLAKEGFVAGKNELFPIPQRQIELSGGLLTQNPGY